MKSATPYGSELKFFLLDGEIPMRQSSPSGVPEILHPDGQFHPYYDTYRFHHDAEPIGESQFAKAVQGFSAQP